MPRQKSTWPIWLMAGIVCVALVLGAFVLEANGVIEVPWRQMVKKPQIPAGAIAVPVAALKIPAYTKIRREHLWDATRGQLRVVYLDRAEIPDGVFTKLSSILGRVLDHDKAPGYVFTEDDFYPKGTREGLVAGVPPDKMMMAIDARNIAGLYGLRPGDRFDVIETLPVDPKAAELPSSHGIYRDSLNLEMRMANWSSQAEVRLVVRGGSVVSPVATRTQPSVSSSLSRGSQIRNLAIQELYIAIDPKEVGALTQALTVGSDLRAVVRSGHAEAREDVSPEPHKPVSPLTGVFPARASGASSGPRFVLVERLGGGERRLTAVPRYSRASADSRVNIVPTSGPDAAGGRGAALRGAKQPNADSDR